MAGRIRGLRASLLESGNSGRMAKSGSSLAAMRQPRVFRAYFHAWDKKESNGFGKGLQRDLGAAHRFMLLAIYLEQNMN